MNQQFSFPRFRRLFSRHTAEFLPGYLLGAVVLAGALLLVLSFAAYSLSGEFQLTEQGAFFLLFLLAAGSIFTSTVFAQFSDRGRAPAALTLPASQLEKYLVAWLYSLPIFLLVFVSVFYLVDAAVLYGSDWQGRPPRLLNVFAAHGETYGAFWFYLVLNAAGLWGAIFFEKMHFVKTAFTIFLVIAAVLVVNGRVLKALLSHSLRAGLPFAGVTLEEENEHYRLVLPDAQMGWLLVLALVLAALLWRAAYVRLMEKQL